MALNYKASGGGGIRPANIKIGGSGGGSNALMNMMLTQSMLPQKLEVQGQAKQAESQADVETAKNVLGPGSAATKSAGGSITVEGPESRKYTAQAMNQLSNVKLMRQGFSQLESLAQKIPGGLMQGGLEALKNKMSAGNWGDQSTKLYMDMRPSMAVNIYRAITGDTRMSDFDAQRALSLIWHPAEPDQIKEGKFSFLNRLMQEAESNVNPLPVSGSEEASSRFNKMLDTLQYSGNQGTTPSTVPNAQTSPNLSQTNGVANPTVGRMKVIDLVSGKRGTINANDFDPNKYSKA
jgi:hypothetical protein